MNNNFKKPKVARSIMIIVIVACGILGNYNSLNRLSNVANKKFLLGENNSGLSLSNDLNDMAKLAQNILSVASVYDYDGDISELETSINVMLSDREIFEKFEHKVLLEKHFNQLYTDLVSSYTLENNHQVAIKNAKVDFDSIANIITHSSYNSDAQAFNQALNTNPSKLFNSIYGYRPLPIFN